MPETAYVLLSDGSVMAHDLPLPAGIADRIAKQQLSLVNEDGSSLAEAEAEPVADPEPAPAPKKATAKPKE